MSTSDLQPRFRGFLLETYCDWYIIAEVVARCGCLLDEDVDVAVLYWTAYIVASYLLKLTSVVFREL